MHITVDRNEFLQHLEMVNKVSTKHATLPVLQCVFLEVKDNKLTLAATNLEIGIKTTLGAKIDEEGVIAVPANTLTQTITHLHQKEVILKIEDTVLIVEGSGFETTIKSIPHDEFPTIPKLEAKGIVIQKELFALGIKSVAFSASVSSIKPELGSVFITQKKEHTLTFVATDSFRLMEKTVPQKNVILDDSILIPYKNAVELARVCDVNEGEVELLVTDNQCALKFSNGVYITSRLTNGSFPDYTQIIPKEYSTHTTVLKSDLQNAFKMTNIFLNKFLQVTTTATPKALTLSANSGEVGTTTESISAQTEGEELTVSFNQRYLSEPLSHITDDSITLHFAGIGRPLVIEGVNDKSVRYLVMPMNK